MSRRSAPPAVRALILAAGLLALSACAAPRDEDLTLSLEQLTADIDSVSLDEAEADLAAGRHEAARQKFARYSIANPDDARSRLGLAESLLRLGRAEEALETFAQLSTEPDYRAPALQGQGLALLALGRTDEAGKLLTEAVELDADQWRAWNAAGQYYDLTRQWTAANAAYEQALARTPSAPVVLNNQGMSLMFQKRFADAEGKFRQALQADPALSVARNNLRLALAWQGRYDEAAVGARRAELADVLNDIGFIALMRKDYGVAKSYLTRALEASPSFHRAAWENLQRLKDDRGKAAADPSPVALSGPSGTTQ